MSKWEKVKLGDLGDFKSGGTPSRNKPEYFLGDIPWITTVSLGDMFINDSSAVEFITEDAIRESSTKLIKSESVMIGVRVGVGKASINAVPMATNQDITSIENIDENKVYKPYLISFIRSCMKIFDSSKRGATIKGVNSEMLKSLMVPLPPLEVQKQIAQNLDTVSELLALRKKQLEELDELIKSVFYDMFGDPVTNDKGWEKKQLSDLADIIMGQSPPGESYNCNGVGTPLLNGPTEFGAIYPVEKQWTTKPTKLCKEHDILFCVRGATAGRMNTADKEYCLGRGLAAIRPKNSAMREFLYLYVSMMYSYFQNTSNGSTFINISKEQLSSLTILSVEKVLQEEFSTIVTKIEEQKALVKQSIEETQQLFDSLMSQYFD